jgi:large subunit ribosomal protein L31
MKKGIHPTYHDKAKVVCACGNSFTTGSVREEIRVDLCHKCHPFFTGEQKFVDSEGRVERFKRLASLKQPAKEKQKVEKKEEERPKTLKEMLTSLEEGK